MFKEFDNEYLYEMYCKLYNKEEYQKIKNKYVAEELYRVIMMKEEDPKNREEIIKIFNNMFN